MAVHCLPPLEKPVMPSRVVLLCALLIAVASPVAAQSTYVSASLLGEFSRYGGVDIDDDNPGVLSSVDPLSRDGETLGFDVRIGRALGERWGVELGFARGGTIEQRQSRSLLGILTSPTVPPTLPGLPTRPTLPFPIPDFEFELLYSQQHTTIDTVAWLRQELSERVDLVFAGGVSFSRVETGQGVRITDDRLAIYLPYPSEIETTQYGTGAVVGVEGLFELSDHAAITGGVRVHGVAGGWLIRPAAGLRWSF